MVNRAVRLRDLLDRLDINHSVSPHDGSGRALRKRELRGLYAALDLDGQPTGTVPDIRSDIRAVVLETEQKAGTSRFSASELRRLGRAVKTSQEYLDAAAAMETLDELPACGATVTVNGTKYIVTGTDVETDAVSEAYDEYALVHLDDNYRLAIFYEGWNGDICRYRTSAALEVQRRDPPYQEWRKEAYISSLSVEPATGDAAATDGEHANQTAENTPTYS